MSNSHHDRILMRVIRKMTLARAKLETGRRHCCDALRFLFRIGSIGQILQGSFSVVSKPILQENIRLKALAGIYTMHSFAQLCNLIFLSKFCQNFAKFCKISKISEKIRKFWQNSAFKFQQRFDLFFTS